jgi:glucosamine kinase
VNHLAFDLGQSQSRLRLFGERGETICEIGAPSLQPNDDLAEALIAVAVTAARAFGIGEFRTISGGTTGVFGHVGSLNEVGHQLGSRFGTTRLIVADDALTSYLGALGHRAGVVAAVGTGVVTLGLGGDGRTARVDGAGAMMGDDGAGWWIGRRGLIAAMSASDGRQTGSTALLRAATDAYGPIDHLPTRIAHDTAAITTVAGFAEHVAQVARDGDPVAKAIWNQAGAHIAETIVAAASRVGITNLTYAIVGRIALASDLLEPGLSCGLAQHIANVTRVDLAGTSIDGAVILARKTAIGNFIPLAGEYIYE